MKCIVCHKVSACFNVENQPARYCATCKDVDMIDIKHPKCTKCKIKRPNFNKPGEITPLYCAGCALDGMVNIKSPKCTKCKIKLPSFNKPGEITPLYCAGCALDGMVDIKNPKCVICKIKQPNFNKPGEITPLYCAGCALDGMVNIKSPRCVKCKIKHPTFNKPGETAALYCSGCALDGMVDTKNPKCVICKIKQPTFNKPGETKALYCAGCALDGMVDIKHPKCSCGTRANYGIIGLKPSHCSKHKQTGMIINPRSKCNVAKCKQLATHGLIEPIRCEEHAEEIHHNLINRECKQCHAIEVCNEEQICYEYCVNTDIYKNRLKFWESRIVMLLNHKIKKRFESLNAPLDTSCNSKRPDIVYNCGSFLVIVECDEKQHRAYGDQCEINRMIMIAQAAGLPVIFIRYNPDSFLDNDGKKSTISDSEREQHLLNIVKGAFSHPTTNLNDYIRVVYLFYDGYNIPTANEPVKYDTIKLPAGFFDCRVEMENNKKRKREALV